MRRGIRSMSWLIRQIAEEPSWTDSGWVKQSSGKECLAWKASLTLRRHEEGENTLIQPAESSLPYSETSKVWRPCWRHVYFMRPITVIWSLAFCSTWAGLQTARAKVALHTRSLIIAFSSLSRTQSTFEQSCLHMSMKWWGKARVEVSLIALMWARVHLH